MKKKTTYGMPNDLGYEVGDSYYFEVDVDTNRTVYLCIL